ncbi:hypothetical protein ScPMuIL_013334 [Solemya velum]
MDRRQPRTNTKDSRNLTCLTAVALQDHLVKSLGLGKPIGPRNIGLGPAARSRSNKNVRSVIDTGRYKPKPNRTVSAEDEEYVLDPKPAQMTLAQKMGLVAAPQQPLTENEWANVKLKSNNREDSAMPCVICKEDFRTEEQVLLSCTHVFHKTCLQAFERFTGRKSCPMCRKEQYQTRVIHEGSKLHRIKCAVRIQSAWRGYVVRCWYMKLRDSVPPKDDKLRKKYYEEKLEKITDRIVKSCDFNVNFFLTEMDRSLEESREVFRNFDALYKEISDAEWESIQLKAVERGEVDCPICLSGLGLGLESGTVSTTDKQKPSRCKAPHSRHVSTEWPAPKINQKCERKKSAAKQRHTVLLSCSHMFHEICLMTFEELDFSQSRHICPVCRSPYQRKSISF